VMVEAMGWPSFFVVSVVAALPGLLLLAGGGLAYMVGIAFYKWRSLRYHHAVWHGFVLLGSSLYFFLVLFYVIPWPGSSVA